MVVFNSFHLIAQQCIGILFFNRLGLLADMLLIEIILGLISLKFCFLLYHYFCPVFALGFRKNASFVPPLQNCRGPEQFLRSEKAPCWRVPPNVYAYIRTICA